MIYVLIVIAILLLLLVQATRALNANFVRWATEDMKYKSYDLSRRNG